MKRLLLSLLALAATASSSVLITQGKPARSQPAQNQPAQSQPNQSQPVPMRLAHNGDLSPEHLEQLKALDTLVALPMALPVGFTPVEVRAEVIPGGVGGGPFYSIRFQHYHNGQCFFLDGSTGGFGGPVPENSEPLRSPLNSPQASDRLYWSDTSSDEGPFPTPVVFSEWLQGKGELLYRVASGMNFGTDCQRVSPELVTQVIDSLDYINFPNSEQPNGAPGEAVSGETAYLNPESLQGMEEEKAIYTAERHGYHLLRASRSQVVLSNGRTDLVLMRNLQTGRIESVMSGEAASTMCNPKIEPC